MKKSFLYVALGLMGLMGTLAMGVVNAEPQISEPYGHIEYTLNENEHFEAQVITITGDDGTVITILDRNLGATAAGTGCDKNTNGGYCPYDETYGYHFQWGNNHGFKPGCDLSGSTRSCSDTITSSAVDGQVDATTISYNPSKQEYYNSGVFYKGNTNWLNDDSKVDLWGGNPGDTFTFVKLTEEQAKLRRGPCPEGFHVPSLGELFKMFTMFFSSTNIWNISYDDILDMHNQLKIPFAGSRDYYNASVRNLGYFADLWTSSPYSSSDGFRPYSRHFGLYEGGIDGDNYIRAQGNSVRCFYDFYQPFTQSFTLSFMSGDVEIWSGKVESGSVYTDVPGENSTDPIPNMTKEGYNFDGWFLNGVTEAFDFSASITDNLILYAQWTPKEYTITFVDGSGVIEPEVHSGAYLSDTSSIVFPSWNRNGYTISWDKNIPSTMPLNGEIITANWTENKKPSGGSSGGGGRSKTSNDSQISPDPSLSRGEEDSSLIKEGDREAVEDLDSKTPIDSSDKSSEGQTYTQEFQEAYEFAKEKGITTMPTINEANMNGKLTRIAMAKMLSYYAINVLGMKPDETRINKFNDITEKLDAQYDSGVTLAYQLGVMGINMPDNKFRPNDEVTRAEFGTALSRMLYSTPDGKPYYSTHLEKLKAEKIITNDDYKMKELRGYVMIMLMRSSKK